MKYVPKDGPLKEKAKSAVVSAALQLTNAGNVDVAEPDRDVAEMPMETSSNEEDVVGAAVGRDAATANPNPSLPREVGEPGPAPTAAAAAPERQPTEPRIRTGLSAAIMAGMELSSDEEGDEGHVEDPDFLRVEITRELDVYLQQPRAKFDVKPLDYWSTRKDTFPRLAPVATAYHACPPSSVTSERSLAGEIVSKKQCALKPENLHRLAVIKVNQQNLK